MSDALFGPAGAGPAPSVRRLAALAARVPAGAPRFLLAGGIASLLNWLVRFPLSAVLPFEAAVALAYGAGMVVGFALYRSWVFPGSRLPLGAQLGRFLGVNAAGLGVVILAAAALVPVFAWRGFLPAPAAEGLAHGLAIVLGAVVNFAGHRALTFARRRRGA